MCVLSVMLIEFRLKIIYDVLTCFPWRFQQRLVKFSKMGENIIQLIKFCEHLELSHKLTENGDSNRNYANLATAAMNESFVDSAKGEKNQVRNDSGDTFCFLFDSMPSVDDDFFFS